MVPERVESRATARWTEFLKRKNVTAGGKPVWRYFGTLPGVIKSFVDRTQLVTCWGTVNLKVKQCLSTLTYI